MSQLSDKFLQQLNWVCGQMPRTERVLNEFSSLPPVKIAICTHLDIKMVPVFEGLLNAGCQLFITTCDPNTVRDEVVVYLVSKGAEAEAWKGMSQQAWLASLDKAVAWQPQYICEFGGELTALYHHQQASGLVAAMEGTGSGVAKLRPLALSVPVLNWDDLDAKEGLHNRHMVGLTAWQAFCERTHLTLHEKRVTLLGYGLVGQGVAAAARAYGGQVTVIERDPARQLMAAYDGWATAALDDVLASTDVLVTATGAKAVVGRSQLSRLKSGAFVMNVGHGSGEIKMAELSDDPVSEVMPHIHQYYIDGRSVYVLANGAMFNLTAGFGDSINAFDVTLAIMAGGLKYMLLQGKDLPVSLHLLPEQAWKSALS
ncbi:adenosylhomocysteinase [Agarivorans sp. QJM3NY_29]|uniref:adenosylhomocysteinase n=1 Tax=unclassified Agarivorans TaxID=2636026 RepID=UPI003D7E3440